MLVKGIGEFYSAPEVKEKTSDPVWLNWDISCRT